MAYCSSKGNNGELTLDNSKQHAAEVAAAWRRLDHATKQAYHARARSRGAERRAEAAYLAAQPVDRATASYDAECLLGLSSQDLPLREEAMDEIVRAEMLTPSGEPTPSFRVYQKHFRTSLQNSMWAPDTGMVSWLTIAHWLVIQQQ